VAAWVRKSLRDSSPENMSAACKVQNPSMLSKLMK